MLAVFFAASIDELCELLDVSDIIGGLGVRLVQGVAGGAMIIKGGQLTRAYLMRGVSVASKKKALEEFRKSAPNVFGEFVNTLKKHGVSVGLSLLKPKAMVSDVDDNQ